jgi:hypothetical protein
VTIKNYVFFQTLTISPEKRLFPLILHYPHATFGVATLLDFKTLIDVHMISQGHYFPPVGEDRDANRGSIIGSVIRCLGNLGIFILSYFQRLLSIPLGCVSTLPNSLLSS